jgi:hypothetical protein
MRGHPIKWRPRELAFIKRRRTWERSRLHAAFVKTFRRRDVSLAAIRSLCKRNGWLTGPRKGRFTGRLLVYTKAELTWIKRRRATPRRELHALFIAAFPHHTVSLEGFKQLCTAKGFLTGRDGRLVKGNVPANKGKKMPFNPNSARTQFKKGQRSPNTKYAGHERIDKDGYVWISVDQTNPHTGFERRYVFKHRWLWEQQNGPVPDGMVLKCKGKKSNPDPSNWELVPRALLPRLNNRWGRRYDDAPEDLKPTMVALARLEQRLRDKQRRAQ